MDILSILPDIILALIVLWILQYTQTAKANLASLTSKIMTLLDEHQRRLEQVDEVVDRINNTGTTFSRVVENTVGQLDIEMAAARKKLHDYANVITSHEARLYSIDKKIEIARNFNPVENLEKIRSYTHRTDVVPLSHVIETQDGITSIRSTTGAAICKGILNHPEVAVMYITMEANTVGASHTQAEAEYVIVVEGEVFQNINGVITSAKAGGHLFVPPNNEHQHYCETPSKAIAVSVPSSEGYPND